MQASVRLSSSATSRKVIAGVSSATTRSCYRTSRGKAHAAPLLAQELPQKGQKRLTKHERRVKIMQFVEKECSYRASNEGKFPTVTNTRQQIGGSHYTVRVVLQEMEYNHAKSRVDNAKAAPLEHSRPKVATGKTVDAPALSDQTEGVIMKELTDKPDPGNQERKIEANKFDLKNLEKSLNANDSNATDQSGSDIVKEAKTHTREDNPKLEESADTGLLGSLKSFAYGIRNFWKNM